MEIVMVDEAHALLAELEGQGFRLQARDDGGLEIRPWSKLDEATKARILAVKAALRHLLSPPPAPDPQVLSINAIFREEEPEQTAPPPAPDPRVLSINAIFREEEPGCILLDGRVVEACEGAALRWKAWQDLLETPRRDPLADFVVDMSWLDVCVVRAAAIPGAPSPVPEVVDDRPVPQHHEAEIIRAALHGYDGPVALDLETSRFNQKYGPRPFGYAGGQDKMAVLSIALYKETGPEVCILHLPDGEIPASIKAELSRPGRTYIWHNGSRFDLLFLAAAGVDVFGAQHYDTQLAAEVLMGGQDKWTEGKEPKPVVHVSYKEEVQRRLGVLVPKELQKIHWDQLPQLGPDHLRYCAYDVLPLLPLALAQLEAASAAELHAIALEQQLTAVTTRTTINGMPIWAERLDAEVAHHSAARAAPEQALSQMFPGVNLRSPKLRLAMEERYACTIESLDKDHVNAALAQHQPWEESAHHRQAYQKYDRRLRMAQDYLTQFHGHDGCMHGTFLQYGARSGRMSSKNPNEQQVPRDFRHGFGFPPLSKNGKNTKNSEDECLVIIDLSQIELCLMAVVSGDERLQAAVESGKVYQAVAADLLKCPIESITEEVRQTYKAYVLAMQYGGTADVLVKKMAEQGRNMPETEAEHVVATYLKAYPGIAQARAVAKQKKRPGLPLRVQLATGLCRLYRRDQVESHKCANSLLATRVSGLAAAGLKIGLLLAHDQGLDRYLANIVHDEVVLRVPRNQATQIRDAMAACIKEGTRRCCPAARVEVEAHIGPSWNKKEHFSDGG